MKINLSLLVLLVLVLMGHKSFGQIDTLEGPDIPSLTIQALRIPVAYLRSPQTLMKIKRSPLDDSKLNLSLKESLVSIPGDENLEP